MSPTLIAPSDELASLAAPASPLCESPNSQETNTEIRTDLESAAPHRGVLDRAEINRQNAQRSTGPKSAEGKSRVSMNALKLGMYSQQVLLPHEDPALYAALGDSLVSKWLPQTDEERALVRKVQEARWRADRVMARETAALALVAEQQRSAVEERFEGDPEAIGLLAQAAGFQANLRLFEQLNRFEGRLERSAEKAERKLRELAAARPFVSPPLPRGPAHTAELPPASRHTQAVAAGVRSSAPAAASETAAETPCSNEPGFVPAISENAAAATDGFVPAKSESALTAPRYPANMPVFKGPMRKEHRKQWLRKNGYSNLPKAA